MRLGDVEDDRAQNQRITFGGDGCRQELGGRLGFGVRDLVLPLILEIGAAEILDGADQRLVIPQVDDFADDLEVDRVGRTVAVPKGLRHEAHRLDLVDHQPRDVAELLETFPRFFR